VTTGEKYTPNGTELDLSKGDQSASAVVSTQPLIVDGVERSDIQAYNIGGSNYFKLRDLASALGFAVDYDPSSNTAVVISHVLRNPVEYTTEEYFFKSNDGFSGHSLTTFNQDGNVLTTRYNNVYSDETSTYTYDDLGRRTSMTVKSAYTYEGETETAENRTEYVYDVWGNLVKETDTGSGDYVSVTTYAYDDQANLIRREQQYNGGSSVDTYVYDEKGNLVKETSEDSYGWSYSTLYAYDDQGNMIRQQGLNGEGDVNYTEEYQYRNGLVTKVLYQSAGDYVTETDYEYDEQGNNTLIRTRDNSGVTENIMAYDEAGRMIRTEYKGDGYGSVTTYTYDAQGRETASETRNADGTVSRYTIEYDEEGRIARQVSESGGMVSASVYTYDQAAGKRTVVETTTYPPAEQIFISSDELAMGVGDTFYLYVTYQPMNAAAEKLTWTSSDPQVASVDAYGCVTALEPGQATITAATDSGLRVTAAVTVEKKFTLTLSKTDVTVTQGYSTAVNCIVRVAGDWIPYRIVYSGGDPAVAELSWDGGWNEDNSIDLYVKGVGAGTAKFSIFVTVNEEYAGELVELTVTVK
jgi:YD repeat-containing protein